MSHAFCHLLSVFSMFIFHYCLSLLQTETVSHMFISDYIIFSVCYKNAWHKLSCPYFQTNLPHQISHIVYKCNVSTAVASRKTTLLTGSTISSNYHSMCSMENINYCYILYIEIVSKLLTYLLTKYILLFSYVILHA